MNVNNVIDIIRCAKEEGHRVRIFMSDSRSVGLYFDEEDYIYKEKRVYPSDVKDLLKICEYKEDIINHYVIDCDCITHIHIIKDVEDDGS